MDWSLEQINRCLDFVFLPKCQYPTHLLVKLNGILEEGWMMNKIIAAPVVRYLALDKQRLVKLICCARQEQFGVPQIAHHGHKLLIEILVCCSVYVKCLLRFKKIKLMHHVAYVVCMNVVHKGIYYLVDCSRGMQRCQMVAIFLFFLI